MGLLVAIEGGDGAGKATAAANLVSRLTDAGRRATVVSFPRYADTVGGHVLGEFLSGRLPRTVTPRTAATLYALDRFESRTALLDAAAAHDVVVLDRYIASNIAYQAASADAADAMIDWILALETGTFAMPTPALNVYLDTPVEAAQALILKKRQRSYTDRSYDEYEQDLALQRRVRANYATMAERGVLGDWRTVRTTDDTGLRAPEAIADEVAAAVLTLL